MALRIAAMFLMSCVASRADQVPDSRSQRVLFIGNSYTGFNKLPEVFQKVVASEGLAPLEIKAAIHPGMRLDQQLGSADTLALIDEGNWGFVILQPQSEEAAKSEQFPELRSNFLNSATGLYDRIKAKSPRATIILYQTWARHADYWKDAAADHGVGNSPADMQARNRKWYQNAVVGKRDFIIAPVGDAWESNYKNPNAVRLHKPDNSHPTFSGSYLAALVLYGTIYHPSNLDVSYHGALGRPEALHLQAIATQAMRIRHEGKPLEQGGADR